MVLRFGQVTLSQSSTVRPRFELAALRYAVKAKPAYIGLLGSTNKARKHKEQLKSEGFDEKVLDVKCGPIGLDINAETPARSV